MELPLEHPLFHVLYDVHEKCKFRQSVVGRAGRQHVGAGRDSAEVHVRGITDRDGHLLVVMTHNTDFGDSFEREGDSRDTSSTSPAKATRSASTCCCTR
jgi:hypothetical protein